MFDKNGLKEFLSKCLANFNKPAVLSVFLVLIVCGAFAFMPVMIQRGNVDTCKAWRYLGANPPADISSCCADIEEAGDLTGDYLKACCDDSDFAKSSDLCKEQKAEEVSEPKEEVKAEVPTKKSAKCDKSKITVSCSGKRLSTMSNGVYDSVIECKAEGCLPGYSAFVSGSDIGGAYNFSLKNGETKKWTSKNGGDYDNPNPCRSCAIVRDSDEKAVKWESPCSGGNMIYDGKKWGNGDTGNTNCSVTYEGE